MTHRTRNLCLLAALPLMMSTTAAPPASANDFWGGAAVGIGSTLLFQGVRHAYQRQRLEEQQQAYVPPPPPPVHHESVQQQLEVIKKYCDEGLFTPEECNAKRQKILDAL